MHEDKRKGDKPVPDHIEDYLNQVQLAELHTIEKFGWGLKFIRRPLFQEPVVVVTNQEGNSMGILDADGILNLDSGIDIREQVSNL